MGRKNKNRDAEVVKKAGIFVLLKKTIGKLTKLAVIAGIGAAVVKAVKGQQEA